jgi:hypothetical protein
MWVQETTTDEMHMQECMQGAAPGAAQQPPLCHSLRKREHPLPIGLHTF